VTVDALGGLATWLLAFAAGAVVVRLLVAGAADVLAAPALRRRNYRDHEVATAGGVLIVLALVPIEAVRAGLELLDLGREGASEARALVLLACLGFGLLGFVDDVLGTPDDRGFRGHLGALARGRVTTGTLKLAGGGALALVLVATARPLEGWQLVADALVVALAANLVNLLDRAPGRAIKASMVAAVPLALAAGSGPVGLALAPVLGGALGLLGDDLRERLMLGDTGANVLGAALGLGAVLELGEGGRLAVLAVLVAVNVAAEVVSLSSVIDRTPPLRRLDRLGRRPAP
jgi:UDP-N-acetylmuramyl pentapeptide phosphotransferase/UDP-N-acetylglucosamine-1-phosphate transferase